MIEVSRLEYMGIVGSLKPEECLESHLSMVDDSTSMTQWILRGELVAKATYVRQPVGPVKATYLVLPSFLS